MLSAAFNIPVADYLRIMVDKSTPMGNTLGVKRGTKQIRIADETHRKLVKAGRLTRWNYGVIVDEAVKLLIAKVAESSDVVEHVGQRKQPSATQA
jgi:hypothetical protein